MDLEARTQAVLTQLRTVANLNVYDGEPTAAMDSDGKAHPYAALYVSPGWRDPFNDTAEDASDLTSWTFQVTAAGGDIERARRAITRVIGVLDGYRLAPEHDPIRLDGEPAFISVDRDVKPPRYYAPLIFTVALANTPA